MKWKQIASGGFFALGMLCLGFTTGGVVGSRMSSPGGMGWDHLADMLGGMMVGVIVSVVLAGAIVGRLSPRQRVVTAVVCVLLSSLVLTFFQRIPSISP